MQTNADNPKILFVLGMHRSGTSAITRVISLLGDWFSTIAVIALL